MRRAPADAHREGQHEGHPRKKCPLCNPPPAPKVSSARTSWTHRGYVVRWNRLNDYWWVEKGGALIARCTSLEDGRKTIDELLDDGRSQATKAHGFATGRWDDE